MASPLFLENAKESSLPEPFLTWPRYILVTKRAVGFDLASLEIGGCKYRPEALRETGHSRVVSHLGACSQR